MRINTYDAIDKKQLESRLLAYNLSKDMLEGLKAKGFKTINEAWRSVVKNRVSERELDKFAKLLGDNIEARKDAHSWGWFKKYGGKREVYFVYMQETWNERPKILTLAFEENLNIERHYCGNSLNIVEHTVDSLLETCIDSITRLENALPLYEEIEQRVADYEAEIEKAVSLAYDKHIAGIGVLVTSKSL